MLLRLLFPSWAFFDTVGDVPVLEACLSGTTHSATWRAVLEAPARSLTALLYNPEGTVHLALQGAVDRLAVECEHMEPDAVTRGVVASIAESAVRDWVAAGERAAGWKWRVVAVSPQDRSGSPRVLYESEAQPLGE